MLALDQEEICHIHRLTIKLYVGLTQRLGSFKVILTNKGQNIPQEKNIAPRNVKTVFRN